MTVAASNLTHGNATTVTNFNTAAVDLVAGRLYLFSVAGFTFSSPLDTATPIVTGGAWTLVARCNFGTQDATFVYRCLPSSSFLAQVVNFDFDAGDNGHAAWAIDELTGIDIGGANGANAIVQSAAATVGTPGFPDPGPAVVTLAAFADPTNNASWGTFGGNLDTPVAGSGFTNIAVDTGGQRQTFTEFKNTGDTTVDLTLGGDSYVQAIALEIKAAITSTTDQLRRNRRMNQAGRQAVIQRSGQW